MSHPLIRAHLKAQVYFFRYKYEFNSMEITVGLSRHVRKLSNKQQTIHLSEETWD